MKYKIRAIAHSSVVGSGVMILSPEGPVIGQIIIATYSAAIRDDPDKYRAFQAEISSVIEKALKEAFEK